MRSPEIFPLRGEQAGVWRAPVNSPTFYLFAADLILFVHIAFVVFVVFGLILIFAGKFLDWSWVRNRCFRVVHLLAIAVVVLQSWLDMICPLTTWEMALRAKAGDSVYAGTFISHWMENILYYNAPAWVFVLCYTVFALLVIYSWYYIPPAGFRRKAR